jgi:hypothetical protein
MNENERKTGRNERNLRKEGRNERKWEEGRKE